MCYMYRVSDPALVLVDGACDFWEQPDMGLPFGLEDDLTVCDCSENADPKCDDGNIVNSCNDR